MPDLSFDFAHLEPRQRYKLLCGLVVQRPIALVTTLAPDGIVNAAPFSFFNVFSEAPALIVLGLQHNADGTPKDTTRHIHVTGEFVVNLVDEAIAEAMNLTAIDFPPGRERAGDCRPRARCIDTGEAAPARHGSRRVRMPARSRVSVRAAARAADRRGAGRACARGHR